MLRLMAALIVLAAPVSAQDVFETSAGTVRVDPVLSGLDEPWGVAFLPDGGLLVTERGGELILARDGTRPVRLAGVPDVAVKGQGGLLDVVVARDFASSSEIFLTYAEPRDRGAATALAVARLDAAGGALSDVRVIFRQKHSSGAGQHFGSRVVEARDGTLYLTIGDRGARGEAQDLNRHNGKVIRVNRDGSVPSDNPFAGGGGLPEIWSYGHRNPQGAALDGQGRLWTVEHGAAGGDEINRPEKGRRITVGRSSATARIIPARRLARGPRRRGWSSRSITGTPPSRPPA